MRRLREAEPRRIAPRHGFALTLVLAVLLLVWAATPALAGADLRGTLNAILVRYHLTGPGTAVRVWSLETGTQLYGRNTHARLAPASNEKLVTSAAALHLWGSGYRFKTELYAQVATPDQEGVLQGDIVLKGYGDPTLSTAAFQRRVLHFSTADIRHFVAALKGLGVHKVRGRILADESRFDRMRTVIGWKPEFAAFCGPLSALSLDQGIRNGRRVSQPALFAARELRRLLIEAHISVSGGVALGRVAESAILLHTEYSAPLWRVLRFMNKQSDNFTAEMLTKGLGGDFGAGGSTAAGLRVERAFLAECGIDLDEVRLRDGSGLCYANRISAAAVTRLLSVMSERLDFDVYWTALPVAGTDGTLRARMRGSAASGNLHAKTGTLNIASSLSGYVTTADHQGLIFSILMNGAPLDAANARRAQDAIGGALAASRP